MGTIETVEATATQIDEIFHKATQDLAAVGLATEYYIIPKFTGYSSITGTAETDVYCLESRLGSTHNRPGYSSYAVAQVFHPRYPSMGLIFMISRSDVDGSLDSVRPTYNPRLDMAFSFKFLKRMHTAFNPLDPSRQNKGLLVQSYQASITLTDIPTATIASADIVLRFKKDGQLASIAVDFSDPFTILVAKLLFPLKAIRDMHYIPRTKDVSALQIPVRGNSDGPALIGGNSTALDQGFEIAIKYLEDHYHKTHPITQA